ncbi:MAG: GNAT family N-acetyltransferase [Actinomycetota bacterium]|nr:GNAT family N-acetyltransferase [Actinomycetota bacterium]
MTITIRKAGLDDVRPLGAALARAFTEDPVMQWLVPAMRARNHRLPRMFAMELLYLYLPYDEVYTTRDLVGGALWAPPGGWRTPLGSLVRALPRLVWTLRGHMPAAMRSVTAIERIHPQEAHWYLAVVGTEPSYQHQGIGSALVAPVLERCDRDFIPAYLESSREDNLEFYQRLGFEVTGTLDLPGDGPRVWPMWREPRP